MAQMPPPGIEAAKKPERQPGSGEAGLHPQQRQELPSRSIEIIGGTRDTACVTPARRASVQVAF